MILKVIIRVVSLIFIFFFCGNKEYGVFSVVLEYCESFLIVSIWLML